MLGQSENKNGNKSGKVLESLYRATAGGFRGFLVADAWVSKCPRPVAGRGGGQWLYQGASSKKDCNE
jgi:hypothetical protein